MAPVRFCPHNLLYCYHLTLHTCLGLPRRWVAARQNIHMLDLHPRLPVHAS